jgi:thioredoxin 1
MSDTPPPAEKKKFQFLGTLIALLAVVLVLRWTSGGGIVDPADETALPESTIPWREDYAAALEESKSSGKPVLVVFSASWCPPCKTMKREVWPDAEVAAAVESGFVPMYVDVDLKQYGPVVQRYNVRGIPSILILDGEGQVLRQAGSMSRSKTLKFLEAGRT